MSKFVIGQQYTFKANEPCEAAPCDRSFTGQQRGFYTPSPTLLKQEDLDWFESKTGFEMPTEHQQYFLSIPRNLTHNLGIKLPYDTGDNSGALGGLAFTHADGTIFQYRPPNGKPEKYLWVGATKLNDKAVVEQIGYKPLFIPALRQRKGKRILVVTEGVTKACAISYIGFDCFHISGVTNWHSASVKAALSVYSQYDEVVLAFDMDLHNNPMVQTQMLKFSQTYGAKVADWSGISEAKGFDDLVIAIGADNIGQLRDVILNAKQIDSGYMIKDADNPYDQMIETIKFYHPTLYFDGSYWVNNGDVIKATLVKELLLREFAKFYTPTKNGKKHMWACHYKEPLDRMETALFKDCEDSAFYMQNGHFRNGKFTPTLAPNPRAVNWSYNPNLEDPHEVIDFLKKVHGDLRFRYWLRALLDDSIHYGSILGLKGKSGSGKGTTLAIASAMLRKLDQQAIPLTQLDKVENVAALGFPRMVFQSDCKRFPDSMEDIYRLSDGTVMSVRPRFGKNYEHRVIKTRIAFACVNLPHLPAGSDGFDRRYKAIECKAYAGIEEEAPQLIEILNSPGYVERLANWALKADLEETKEFMCASAKEGDQSESESIADSPIRAYLDKVMVPDAAITQVSVEDLYEGYCLYSRRNDRKPASIKDFTEYLDKLGVPVEKGISRQLPNGAWVNTPDIVLHKVDERAIAIINEGQGSFKGITNRYFDCRKSLREQTETPSIEVTVAYVEPGTSVPTADLVNPTSDQINKLPNRTRIFLHPISDTQLVPSAILQIIQTANNRVPHPTVNTDVKT